MHSRNITVVIALCLLVLMTACRFPEKRSYRDFLREDKTETKRKGPPEGTTFQLMVGSAQFDDLTFKGASTFDPGVIAEAEIDSMPFMGFVGQYPLAGEDLNVGVEGGFTIGAWGDRDKVYFSNNVLAVDLDSFLFLTDLFLGAFASAELGEKVRFYVGAGPLAMFGYYEYETSDADSDSRATYVHIEEDEAALGVGLYARAGVDFRVAKNTLLGFSVRAIEADLDFGGNTGDVDIDGVQFMLTWGVGF